MMVTERQELEMVSLWGSNQAVLIVLVLRDWDIKDWCSVISLYTVNDEVDGAGEGYIRKE